MVSTRSDEFTLFSTQAGKRRMTPLLWEFPFFPCFLLCNPVFFLLSKTFPFCVLLSVFNFYSLTFQEIHIAQEPLQFATPLSRLVGSPVVFTQGKTKFPTPCRSTRPPLFPTILFSALRSLNLFCTLLPFLIVRHPKRRSNTCPLLVLCVPDFQAVKFVSGRP